MKLEDEPKQSVHNFHVGQPVRYRPAIRLIMGDGIYMIHSLRYNIRGLVELIEPSGDKIEQHPEYFEPAYKLEVGCKVKSIISNNIGVVTNIDEQYTRVHFDYGLQSYEPENLIIIEPSPMKNDNRLDPVSCRCTIEAQFEAYQSKYLVGIDWAKHIKQFGGNEMDIKENYKKLAERMKDEFVGNGIGTIFLKKAGECSIERREIEFDITPEEIEALLNVRGISKALGTFEIETYKEHYNIGIVKFTPIESKKKSKKNEAD